MEHLYYILITSRIVLEPRSFCTALVSELEDAQNHDLQHLPEQNVYLRHFVDALYKRMCELRLVGTFRGNPGGGRNASFTFKGLLYSTSVTIRS